MTPVDRLSEWEREAGNMVTNSTMEFNTRILTLIAAYRIQEEALEKIKSGRLEMGRSQMPGMFLDQAECLAREALKKSKELINGDF